MSIFVSNQGSILESLVSNVCNGRRLSLIKGQSGSGKTHLFHLLKDQTTGISCFMMKGDNCDRTRPYYPFKNLLSEVYANDQRKLRRKLRNESFQNIANQAGSLSPLGSDILSTCISELTENAKRKQEFCNVVFNKEEIELLFPLDYFCGGEKTSVFWTDDLQYWDEPSLQLLYSLIKHQEMPNSFLRNVLFIGTINTSFNQYPELLSGLESKAENYIYELANIPLSEYGKVLDTLGCKVKISEDLISALYSITDGNLQLTADIVLLLQNSSKTEDTIQDIISKQDLGHLIVERLDRCENDGALVNDALKFGSLFGNSFCYHDLQPVLGLHEGKIRNLIEIAHDYALVKKTSKGASFIHELIRETYQKEANSNKEKYYTNFSKCLKIIYPGDYLSRTKSLYTAGQYEEASITYLLYFIKQLRSHKSPNRPSLLEDLSTRLQEYGKIMKDAYQAFDEGNYEQCSNMLDCIEDIYPQPLVGEKYYLLSLTLSKWLDMRSRSRAKVCLEPYLKRENLDCETELWERILSAYIIACVHNNDIQLAKHYEKKLEESIAKRIDFDFEASCRLNAFRRKASSLHSPSIAFQATCKSKDFFAPRSLSKSGGAPLDPVEYYMSLNNYIATALMVGNFSTVFREAESLIKLPLKYKYIQFPRYEMPLNNAILVAYFNHATNASEAEEALRNVLQKCDTENTTAIIIRVNIAVFAALQGKFQEAKTQLEQLFREASEIQNLEYYYSYLIRVNFAAVLYVSHQEEAGIEILEKLSQDTLLAFEESLQAHSSKLLEACRLKPDCNEKDWYQQALPIPDSLKSFSKEKSWNYYGHKYLFGELEFWSES